MQESVQTHGLSDGLSEQDENVLLCSGMVLQKALKQGRNVHGVPSCDECYDQECVATLGGMHAYSVLCSDLIACSRPILGLAECWLGLAKPKYSN